MSSNTPFVLAYRNEVDRATLTSTSSSDPFDGVNNIAALKSRSLADRTSDASTVSDVTATWSDADKATIDIIALLNTEFPVSGGASAGQITIKYKATSASSFTTLFTTEDIFTAFEGSNFPANLILLLDTQITAYELKYDVILNPHNHRVGRFLGWPCLVPVYIIYKPTDIFTGNIRQTAARRRPGVTVGNPII